MTEAEFSRIKDGDLVVFLGSNASFTEGKIYKSYGVNYSYDTMVGVYEDDNGIPNGISYKYFEYVQSRLSLDDCM